MAEPGDRNARSVLDVTDPSRPKPQARAPARILLVRLSHLGDVVTSLPVFHALREGYPGAQIGWAVQTEFAGLLEGLAGLDLVLRFERRGGLRGWLALRRELRAFRPDWTVDAQGNLKSASVVLAAGSPRRTGYHPGEWRERWGSLSTPDRAPRSGAAHAVDRALALARHVAPGTHPRFDPALGPRELQAGRERLRALTGDSGGAPLLLHPGPPADVRAWPSARYGELARLALKRRRPVVLLAGPAEQQVGRELALQLGRAPGLGIWLGAKPLRELAALFRAAAERDGRLVIGDTGPMHLAWASGLVVWLVAGPRDPLRTGPYPPPDTAHSSPHRILRAAEPPQCAPCLAKTCEHPDGPVCLTRIAAEDVLHSG